MKTYIFDPISEDALAYAKEQLEVVTWDDPEIKNFAEAEAVIVRTYKMTPEIIDHMPKLKIIAKHAKKIGIPADVGDLAIPLGANLHKDGACIIQILKISLLCEAFGINYVTPENIFLSIVVAVIASVVMGGIPAGGYVAEIFIVSVFGFPTVSIPIMVLIGTITDAPATVINVTGDTGLAMIISRVVHVLCKNIFLEEFMMSDEHTVIQAVLAEVEKAVVGKTDILEKIMG